MQHSMVPPVKEPYGLYHALAHSVSVASVSEAYNYHLVHEVLCDWLMLVHYINIIMYSQWTLRNDQCGEHICKCIRTHTPVLNNSCCKISITHGGENLADVDFQWSYSGYIDAKSLPCRCKCEYRECCSSFISFQSVPLHYRLISIIEDGCWGRGCQITDAAWVGHKQ